MRAAPHLLALLVAGSVATACLDGPTPSPPPAVARLEITAPDTAGLVGTVLQVSATAYDSAGAVMSGIPLSWGTLDGARAQVDSTGSVRLGPTAGDARITATESRSGRSDTIVVHAAGEGELKWAFLVTGLVTNVSGPALGPDGTVYFLSLPFPGVREQVDLHAVSPRGVERWSLRLDMTSADGHAVGSDGTIYVTGRAVRAVSPTGGILWNHVLTGAFSSGFINGAIAPGGPLIVSGADSPLALDVATGDTIWGGPVSPVDAWVVPPTISGNTVWIKKSEDSLYSFDVTTGAIGKQIADPDSGVDKRSFGVGPVPVGDQLYLPTAFRLAAFDSSGTLRWLTDNRGRGVTEPVIDAAGNLYVQTNADGLLALDPATGAWRWRRLPARPRWTWYGGPALAQGGIIYCAAVDGVYAYDTAGVLNWSYQTMEDSTAFQPFIGAPAIAPDGTVYTYSETRLYAFWASHPPEPNSPWPMWRHDAQRTGVAW